MIKTLRQRADEEAVKRATKIVSQPSEFEALKLIHELEVHQIELEMINDELIQAKEKADIAEQKYTELNDHALFGYFTLSKEGNIVDLNLNTAQMLGKDRESLQNYQFAFFISKDSRQVFKTFMQDVFARIRKESCELILVPYSNQPINVFLTGIASEDRNQCYISLIDITERKKTENALVIAKEKAEANEKLTTAFLQNMSHEIRTPLNGIIGFSDLLKKENLSKKEINEYTNIIKKCGTRLLSMVSNVLDISIIETGQMKVRNTSFSLNTLMAELYSFFTPEAKEKGIKLNYQTALQDENCFIESDYNKLNQILTNLIKNAITWTTSGYINFGYEIKDNEILFYVKDTGIGILKEFHETIFERFRHADMSKAQGLEGAGLGLTICKELLNLLNGKIWLESIIDKGTNFFFTIPLNYSSLKQQIPINIDSIVHKQKRTFKILIAEDDSASFQYFQSVLINDNVKILFAKNGQEAIDLVNNDIDNDIDLVLMDIKMPFMDGIEAAKQIKIIRPELPIVAQTAFTFEEDKERFLAIGYEEYLTKPVSIEDLLKIIDKYR